MNEAKNITWDVVDVEASGDKYESGCGWPSFTKPLVSSHVEELHDNSHRTPFFVLLKFSRLKIFFVASVKGT